MTPANLSVPEWAIWVLSRWCPSASTLTQKLPTLRILGQLVEVRAGLKSTNGGSSESEVNDWQVSPCGPSGPSAATTTMPVQKCPRTLRNSVASTASVGVGQCVSKERGYAVGASDRGSSTRLTRPVERQNAQPHRNSMGSPCAPRTEHTCVR